MADTKLTALTENSTPAATDIMYIVDDPGGSPLSQKITLANLKTLINDLATAAIFDAKGDLVVGTGANTAAKLTVGTNDYVLTADDGEATGLKWAAAAAGGGTDLVSTCDGRLTLTTGVPVTTADVTGATTLYFTPYSGNQIALYDGSTGWDILTFSELSLNISAYTASKPYDIWCYNNTGSAALESTVWTNATTRATALTTQDGVYVKTGATTRRYLGTIYINASGGQTDDSLTKRNVFNFYNRIARALRVQDATASWAYNTAAWRQANNSAANQFEIMVGVAESQLHVTLDFRMGWTTTVANQGGIGEDGVAAPHANMTLNIMNIPVNNTTTSRSCHLTIIPAVGFHYYTWLEYGSGGGTNTWYGSPYSALMGQWRA